MVKCGPSTVGPSVPIRASSNTAANTAGATSIAQRERVTQPASAPTTNDTAIVMSAWPVVSGPRGVHHPDIRPHTAEVSMPIAAPARQSAHSRRMISCTNGVEDRPAL